MPQSWTKKGEISFKITLIYALQRVEKQKDISREVLTITFHPALPSLNSIIQKHWRVMTSSDQDLADCFTKPSIVAYRRSKNLRDILVKAKMEPEKRTRQKIGFFKCKRSCVMCSFATPRQHHRNPISGESFEITSYIDCTTKNVIYRLGCKKCSKFLYIGETARRLCDRFQEHRGYVNQKVFKQPTGEHFNSSGHNVTDLTIHAIEHVKPSSDPFVRKTRETFWIQKYSATKFWNNSRK